MANFVQNSSFCLNAFFMRQFIFPTDGTRRAKKPYGGIKRYFCGWTWSRFKADIDILGPLRGPYGLKL